MDPVDHSFHAVGELCFILNQPITDIRFPAIIDLEKITRLKDGFTAV